MADNTPRLLTVAVTSRALFDLEESHALYEREGVQAYSDYQRTHEDDVLAPGIGEIIGGSQREERLDVLDARMAQFGLDPAHYGWYRDFRRYGTVPHAGFGLGFERLVVYTCGLANIRDAIPYPRAPGLATF